MLKKVTYSDGVMNGVTKHNHKTEILYYPGGETALEAFFNGVVPKK
jgi:antitoxin component YwqK of YwqJK toxin-antitoxin module